MSKKRSPIWNYFDVREDSKVAICNQPVSRGGKTTKTFNTTNLVHHLKVKHTNMYATFKKSDDDLKEASKGKGCASSKSVQLSFDESIERTKKWDINDP